MDVSDETIEAMAREILRKRVGMGDAEGVIASVIANHEVSQTWDWLDSLADAKAVAEALSLIPDPPVSAAPEGWIGSNDTVEALIPLIRDELLRLGWVLVPTLPTDAMLHAAQEAFPRSASFVFPTLWRAMIAAAPNPPASAPEETYPDSASISKAAHSIATLVDEYTNRGWNTAGRANFAAIIKRRLKRFAPKAEVTTL